jgi:hypothetical protein
MAVLNDVAIWVVFFVARYYLFSVVGNVAQTVVRIQVTPSGSSQRVNQDPGILWLRIQHREKDVLKTASNNLHEKQ